MLKRLDLVVGSCWQCLYLRYNEVETDEVDTHGWVCEHPEMGETLICMDEDFDNFHDLYPSGFHKDCPLDDEEE